MAAGPRNHLFFPTNIDPNRTAKMPCVLRKQQADDKKAEIGAEEGQPPQKNDDVRPSSSFVRVVQRTSRSNVAGAVNDDSI
jgi:hypothetical protein